MREGDMGKLSSEAPSDPRPRENDVTENWPRLPLQMACAHVARQYFGSEGPDSFTLRLQWNEHPLCGSEPRAQGALFRLSQAAC